MIEDRLGESAAAVEHLRESLNARVPDARHRLLIYLYLIRAYMRLGERVSAENEVPNLKKQRDGLREWQTILSNEQAETLRKVIEGDIQVAESLINGQMEIDALAAPPLSKPMVNSEGKRP
jgi:hypothetical protein